MSYSLHSSMNLLAVYDGCVCMWWKIDGIEKGGFGRNCVVYAKRENKIIKYNLFINENISYNVILIE